MPLDPVPRPPLPRLAPRPQPRLLVPPPLLVLVFPCPRPQPRPQGVIFSLSSFFSAAASSDDGEAGRLREEWGVLSPQNASSLALMYREFHFNHHPLANLTLIFNLHLHYITHRGLTHLLNHVIPMSNADTILLLPINQEDLSCISEKTQLTI